MIAAASASAQLPAALNPSQPNHAAAAVTGASRKLVTTKRGHRSARHVAHSVQAEQQYRPENGEGKSDVEQHRAGHLP